MTANASNRPGDADPFDPAHQPGGRRSITIGATASMLSGMRREALAVQLDPPGATFSLVSDEPEAVGGGGAAPTAMQYYAASLALSMMSHVNWFAAVDQLSLSDVRVEVTARFYMAGSAQEGTAESGPLEFDSRIEVDSPDPPEAVARALRKAERTCFTHRALVEPVTVNPTFALNGAALVVGGDE